MTPTLDAFAMAKVGKNQSKTWIHLKIHYIIVYLNILIIIQILCYVITNKLF